MNFELPPLPTQYDGIPVHVVGGAVRDQIRGEDPSDFDFVVTEVSPNDMLDRGFTPVNQDNGTFPVFIDDLGREVAIAREDKSTGDGHTDFEAHAVPSIISTEDALKRDAQRRDLTINSIYYNARTGDVFDPHDGADDLESGVIRHVSDDSFADDPLRVLRAARFAARLDASIASETRELMSDAAEDIIELPEERLRIELTKSLVQGDPPSRFFRELQDTPIGNTINALTVTFPVIDMLEHVPAGPPEYHGEGDALSHTMLVLDEMNELRPDDEEALLMSLVHDDGKLATLKEDWPQHHGHGKEGLPIIGRIANRLSMSNEQRRAMREAARQHMRLKEIEDMRTATVYDLYNELYNPNLLLDLLVADAHGRKPQGSFDRSLAERRFEAARRAMNKLGGQDLIDDGIDPQEIGGQKFGKRLRDKRIAIMKGIESELGV